MTTSLSPACLSLNTALEKFVSYLAAWETAPMYTGFLEDTTLHTTPSCAPNTIEVPYSAASAEKSILLDRTDFAVCPKCSAPLLAVRDFYEKIVDVPEYLQVLILSLDKHRDAQVHSMSVSYLAWLESILSTSFAFEAYDGHFTRTTLKFLEEVVAAFFLVVQEYTPTPPPTSLPAGAKSLVHGVLHGHSAERYDKVIAKGPFNKPFKNTEFYQLLPFMTRLGQGFWSFSLPLYMLNLFGDNPHYTLTSSKSPFNTGNSSAVAAILTTAQAFMQDGIPAGKAVATAESILSA